MNYEVEFEKAVYNLLWVCRQYNSWGSDDKYFSHACMGAGENATDFLVRHGYGDDGGWGFIPNEKAITLMDREDLEED